MTLDVMAELAHQGHPGVAENPQMLGEPDHPRLEKAPPGADWPS